MDKVYDIIVLGAGPAGLTAASYAGRSRIDTLLIEGEKDGGQIVITNEIENYPGCLEEESGPSLIARMTKQVEKFGADRVTDTIVDVELDGKIKHLKGNHGDYYAKALVIATGASPRPIGCKGEKEFTGKGVSYCATCDGAFFKGKTVAVNGGGNTALEDALFLSNMCEKVYIIHRREGFRADNANLKAAKARENIEFVLNRTVAQIKGGEKVESVLLSSTTGEPDLELAVDGLFVAIGFHPNTELFEGQLELEGGYIKAGENCRTSIPGVFAAGDVRTKEVRQLITAAADGAVAGVEAGKYLA